jgi:uncharacterized protein
VTFLLDANVLIALIDPQHVHHEIAHKWFVRTGKKSWATCPFTENAVLRIVGDKNYANSPGSLTLIAEKLAGFRAMPSHVFWGDDISLFDAARIDMGRLLRVGQITDSYLLALACAHQGQLATLDRRLVVTAVINGEKGLHLIS